MGLIAPGKPILTGPNVRLRPLAESDADAVLAGMEDAESMRLTGSHGTFTPERVAAHCSRVAAAFDRWDYAIEVPGAFGSRMVGEVVLNEVDSDNRSANIRIVIWVPEARNRGYGTEAMRLMTAFGIERVGLHRIELQVHAFNPRAIRAYEKVGFRLEGTLREALSWVGAWIDTHVMSVLASDWPA